MAVHNNNNLLQYFTSVSYTHLDVYKRQVYGSVGAHLFTFGRPHWVYSLLHRQFNER